MKKRSFRKLTLSRETIRSLDDAHLDAVAGGGTATNHSDCCCSKNKTECKCPPAI
jgi:hypothetical protein